jgi:probable phosphoglycerate mutase
MRNFTCISLVRHGEVLNPGRLVYGRLSGYRLNQKGCRQAHAAGKLLKREPIDAIFSSPLLRARQTAAAICAFHPLLRVRCANSLSEVYTCYEGRPLYEADSRGGDVYTDAPSCFEQPLDIVKRMWTFIKRQRRRFPRRHIVAVTHGDPIAFLLLWLKEAGLDPCNKRNLTSIGIPDNYPSLASITTLTFRSHEAQERPHIRYLKPYDDT